MTPATRPPAPNCRGTAHAASLISALHGTCLARLCLAPGSPPQASRHTALAGELAARQVRLDGVVQAPPPVHPRARAFADGHLIVRSFKPGEDWRYARTRSSASRRRSNCGPFSNPWPPGCRWTLR